MLLRRSMTSFATAPPDGIESHLTAGDVGSKAHTLDAHETK